MQALKVSLVQGATRWHDAPANRDYYGALVRQANGSDLVVLPETFLSGFSNTPAPAPTRWTAKAWRGCVRWRAR